MSTVLYTAVFGGYDSLWPLPGGLEGVCFTDDPALPEAKGWERRLVQLPQLHPRMAAKRFKLMPHAIFPEAERTLWVDANIQVRYAGAVGELLALAEGAGLAMFRHPAVADIQAELELSEPMPKYRGWDLAAQVDVYRREGFPFSWGLWLGGVLPRVRSDLVDTIFDHWWHECCRYGPQDQIAFPPVAWRLGFKPAEMPCEFPGPWFTYHEHTDTGAVPYDRGRPLAGVAVLLNAPPNTSVVGALHYLSAATGLEGDALAEWVMGERILLDELRRGCSADTVVQRFRQMPR